MKYILIFPRNIWIFLWRHRTSKWKRKQNHFVCKGHDHDLSKLENSSRELWLRVWRLIAFWRLYTRSKFPTSSKSKTCKSSPGFNLNSEKQFSGSNFSFKDQADFLVQVSRIGDPSKAFYLYFPIIFGLHRLSGIKFLGTVILCEWLNQILKW